MKFNAIKFNEDARVKIPTMLHLMRLGYQYLSLKGQSWDLDTNIFPELYTAAILKINPGNKGEVNQRLRLQKGMHHGNRYQALQQPRLSHDINR